MRPSLRIRRAVYGHVRAFEANCERIEVKDQSCSRDDRRVRAAANREQKVRRVAGVK